MVVCEHQGWGCCWHSLVFLLVSFGFICLCFIKIEHWVLNMIRVVVRVLTLLPFFLSLPLFLLSFLPLVLLFLFSLYFCTLFWNVLGDSFRWGSLIHQSMKSMSQKVLKEILCYHYQMLFKSMCTKQLGILLQKYKACGVVCISCNKQWRHNKQPSWHCNL